MKPFKWFLFIFGCFLYFYCKGLNGEQVVINELISNVYAFDSKHSVYDFVEISVVGSNEAPNMNPYLILYIQLNLTTNPDPLLIQSISLYQQTVRHHRHGRIFNGFLTYGIVPDQHQETNVKRPASMGSNINWLSSTYYKQKSLFEPVPKLSKNFAVVLLKTDKGEREKFPDTNVLNELKHVDKNTLKNKIFLNEQRVNYILNHAVDALVVVGDATTFNVNPFGRQLMEKLGKEVVMHDLRGELQSSVNFCGPNDYRLSTPTPGTENNCDGDVLPLMAQSTTTTAIPYDDDIQVITESSIQQQRPPKRRRLSASFTVNPMTEKYTSYLPWYAKLLPWIDIKAILKRLNFASDNVIEKMKEYHIWMEIVNVNNGKVVKSTAEFPTKVQIRCKFCYSYRVQHDQCTADGTHEDHKEHPKSKQCNSLNAFARLTGIGSTYNIAYKMKEHDGSAPHKQAVTYFEEKVEAAMKRHNMEKDTVDPTCNMFRLVYTETMANIPFIKHPEMVSLMKMNKVDVGSLHFSKYSSQKIQESIAKTLHNDLVNYLKSQSPPISIILDTSTDSNGRNILLLYLRVFFNNYPHVYFYRAVQLQSEKAESIMQKLKEVFANDGTLDLVQTNLKGVATDGKNFVSF